MTISRLWGELEIVVQHLGGRDDAGEDGLDHPPDARLVQMLDE